MNVMTPRAANAGAVSQREVNAVTDPIVSPNTETDNLKRCTKCGEWKPATLDYFSPRKISKSGLASWCRDCKNALGKKWREENPDYSREWKKANPSYFSEWKKANPDYMKRWHSANLEKRRRDSRYHSNKRRAKQRQSTGTHTAGDIKAQYDSQKGKCWWCGKKIKNGKYHVDHRIPLAKGGSNDAANIVVSCPRCNMMKGAKLPWEFNDRLL